MTSSDQSKDTIDDIYFSRLDFAINDIYIGNLVDLDDAIDDIDVSDIENFDDLVKTENNLNFTNIINFEDGSVKSGDIDPNYLPYDENILIEKRSLYDNYKDIAKITQCKFLLNYWLSNLLLLFMINKWLSANKRKSLAN